MGLHEVTITARHTEAPNRHLHPSSAGMEGEHHQDEQTNTWLGPQSGQVEFL